MEKNLEDAIRAISDELLFNPEVNKAKLIEAISQRFDLSPAESEFLIQKYILC